MRLPLWNASGISVSRNDFQRLLCKTGKITKRQIAEDRLNKDFKRTLEAESRSCKDADTTYNQPRFTIKTDSPISKN